MTIGIDIDDTITNSSEVITDYIMKYSDNEVLKNNIEGIIRGTLVSKDTIGFYKEHSIIIGNMIKVKEDASKYIKMLHDEGNKIVIITARNNNYYNDAYGFCKEYLDRNGIVYDILLTDKKYKIEACKENNVDIMIDDAVDTCENCIKNNIKSLLFNSSINLKKETNVKRVDSWQEIYEYINKLKEEF